MTSLKRFEEWWNFHSLGSLGRSDAFAGWEAQDEYYEPIIKEQAERIVELEAKLKKYKNAFDEIVEKCKTDSKIKEIIRLEDENKAQAERIAQLKFEIKQAIVYMETEKPGNTFRLMCLNSFRATLDEMETK